MTAQERDPQGDSIPTPIPWRVGDPGFEDEIFAVVDIPADSDDWGAALICDTGGNVANAKRIVTAVNAHDELVAALDALTDHEGHIWHGTTGDCTGECAAVRAALAKARP